MEPGNYVELRVADTGAGISSQIVDRIFDPFFTTKEIGKGTGLGLSTVYGIVKQSGGHVAAYSELGKGSVFSLVIPVGEKSGVQHLIRVTRWDQTEFEEEELGAVRFVPLIGQEAW